MDTPAKPTRRKTAKEPGDTSTQAAHTPATAPVTFAPATNHAPASTHPRPKTPDASTRRRSRRRRIVLSGLLLATAIALVLLTKQLIPDLSARPEYHVTAAQITITTPPRWIPADIREQIFKQAAHAQPLSLLDDSLSERVAAAFHTHPWVLRVIRVQKMWPARVHVELEWRKPVAMVTGIDGFYPVDVNGVLLPGRDFAPADLKRFPVIENISSIPLGRIGEAWGDPVVHEAAVLAATLLEAESDQDSWWQRFDLAAIVAPQRASLDAPIDDLEFKLRTAAGSSVIWGRGPGSLHPAELSTSRKLERLVEFTERFGPIDDAHGPWQLDIRPWQGMRRSLLATEPNRKVQTR